MNDFVDLNHCYRVCVQYEPMGEWKCFNFPTIETANRYYVELRRSSPHAKIEVSDDRVLISRLEVVTLTPRV